ncbi:MAG: zinc ribbon domain-containing protein [Candidatus Aminicenantales bacterium]
MPIYEYRCRACGQKNSFLVLSLKNAAEPVCRRCGGRDLEKLVSRIAILRSEDDRMEALADSAGLGGADENDPRSMARWMKKMGREIGQEAGQDFERSFEEEAGEDDQTSSGGGGSPAEDSQDEPGSDLGEA